MKKALFIRLISLVLCAPALLGSLAGCSGITTPAPSYGNAAQVRAVYPTMAQYPKSDDYSSESWSEWNNGRRVQLSYIEKEADIGSFITQTLQAFLSDTEDNENRVYSPLNVFMALAMLAEITDGNTRAQVLDLLGFEDVDSLRGAANALWNANYCDDGTVTSILANSIWMRDDTNYNMETLQTLAEEYFASSFKGKMGTEEYNEIFRGWLDEQTGGLLKDRIDELELDPLTVLALASTIYFKAGWADKFDGNYNTSETFHAPDGDKTVTFMNGSLDGIFVSGDKFSAVSLDLENSGSMYVLLPDEGVGVTDLMNDPDALSFISAPAKYGKRSMKNINLSLPKFDVNSSVDLCEKIKSLGVTDCFTLGKADFSRLTGDISGIYVDSVEHTARVKIDEEGLEASAYTIIAIKAGGMLEQEIGRAHV